MVQVTIFFSDFFSTSFPKYQDNKSGEELGMQRRVRKKIKRLSSMGAYLNYGKISRVKTVNDDDV